MKQVKNKLFQIMVGLMFAITGLFVSTGSSFAISFCVADCPDKSHCEAEGDVVKCTCGNQGAGPADCERMAMAQSPDDDLLNRLWLLTLPKDNSIEGK